MMKWLICYLCWLVITWGGAGVGFAQREPEQFRFKHITVNEGLSHSDAMCVAQDKAGFVWIGTNKGIDRYDGYSLKRYDLPLNDHDGIGSNRIRALHVDRSGRIWAGVERAGLFWFDADRDRFVSIRQMKGAAVFPQLIEQLAHTDVQAILSDNQGRLWATTHRYGVFCLETDGGDSLKAIKTVQLINHPADQPVLNKLAVDRQGKIWIGTLGHGLWVFDSNASGSSNKNWQATQVPGMGWPNVRALHLDKRGDLWVGTDNQIAWISQRGLMQEGPLPAHFLHHTFAEIESLFLDSSNRLWISTKYGLLLMQAGAVTNEIPPVDERSVRTFLPLDTDPTSINSVRIHDILEDRFHNLWFATSAGGLNQLRLQGKSFGLLRRQMVGQATPANNYINTLYKEEKSNRLWMGTRNGFASYDISSRSYQNYLNRFLSGTVNGVDVSAIYQAGDGKFWIGTRYGGLYTLNSQNAASLRQLPDVLGTLVWRGISVESIVEDRHGIVWVATFNAGIHAFNRQGDNLAAVEAYSNALPTHQFTALCYEPVEDVLWASTRDAGLLKLKLTKQGLQLLRQFKHESNNPASLRTNYIWPLLKDKRGNLWIGTIGGGLHKLTKNDRGEEVIERYSQWVPETDVEGLLTDEAGNLWIGGSGLYQFNPITKRLLHYDVTDGLQSNSFKVGATYRANDGTLFFGGTNGITYFQPRTLLPNPYPPLMQVTELRILNQPVAIGDTINGRVLLPKPLTSPQTIRLKASENDFSVEFVGLNYANPQKQQYAYRLEGYNDQWIQTTADRRVANFTNLPAGDYTFLVKASNDDGIWAAGPATLHVTILPPWWKTWWAYLLYGLAIVSALAGYRRMEIGRQTLKNTLALAEGMAQKEQELTDLKLRFFTNVSHELRTPLTLIMGPIEELVATGGSFRDKIVLVHQQTRKLLELVNQLLEFRKVESGHVSLRASRGDIVRFVTEIYLIFKLKADECQFDYAMEGLTEPVQLFFDRGKLEIILTNLLSNAFKYTPEGGKIRLRVSTVGRPDQPAVFKDTVLHDNYVQIDVQNWGITMRADELDKLFDPYFQASHTETMHVMGTGIGLSLVKQFVEVHSGEVVVESTAGTGTIFSVRLPFGLAHLSPDAIQVDDEMNELVPPSHPEKEPLNVAAPGQVDLYTSLPINARLLVVEDNDELRQYVKQLFEPMFAVITAVDGLDGWEKTLNYLPDLIVSDVMMPRSDGLALCRSIKQHPKTAHIPVLLLTARVAAAYELEGLETGADEYMAKPFNPKILYAKVLTMLQSRFRLREYYQRQILLEPTEISIPNETKQLLDKAMSIVEANLTNPDFNVQALVHEIGMSQTNFYRQIKAITGQSIVEFIRDVRLKRAAQLLASRQLRVSEVAFMVGIDDLKYFRKTFHNLYNSSPSDYAKQHREPVKAEQD